MCQQKTIIKIQQNRIILVHLLSLLWFGGSFDLVCDSPDFSKLGFFILTLVYSGILFTFVLPQVADKQTKLCQTTFSAASNS